MTALQALAHAPPNAFVFGPVSAVPDFVLDITLAVAVCWLRWRSPWRKR